MANGYLGKISAIVSANTADFSSKLNGAAKDVAKFARTVQGDIGSAMRQADKSITSIYTPLQRLERALRAATSMKLSFTGFPGAIRDIDALKQRLQTGLNDRQISVVLKTSGMSSITAFRDAIQSVDSKTFDVIARVGGVEKLKELRKYLLESTGSGGLYKDVKDTEARVAALRKQMVSGAGENRRAASQGAGGDAESQSRLRSERRRLAELQTLRRASELTEKQVALQTREKALDSLPRTEGRVEEAASIKSELLAVGAEIDKLQAKVRDPLDLQLSTSDIKAQIADTNKTIATLQGQLEKAKAGGKTTAVRDISAELAAEERLLEKQKKLFAKKRVVDSASGLSLEQIDAAIPAAEGLGLSTGVVDKTREALSKSDARVAADRQRRLAAAAREINAPLGDAAASIDRMSLSVNAGFKAALVKSQAEAKALDDTIRNTETSTRALNAQFRATAESVAKLRSAQARVSEADDMSRSLASGQELRFVSPGVYGALSRSAGISEAAGRLSPQSLAGNSGIAQSLAQVKLLSEKVAIVMAAVERRKILGLSTDDAERQLAGLLAKLDSVQGETERELTITLNTEEAGKKAEALAAKIKASVADAADRVNQVITGRPQNIDQARSRQAALESEIAGLDRAQRQNFAPMLRRAGELAASGDFEGLVNQQDMIDIELGNTRRQNQQLADSKAAADGLKNELDQIAAINAPPTMMDRLRQSAQKAHDEVEGVSDALEQARIRGELQSLGSKVRAAASLPPEKRAEELSRIAGEYDNLQSQASARNQIDIERKNAAEIATAMLPPVLQEESDSLSYITNNEGASLPLSRAALEESDRRKMRGALGSDADDPQRQISRLLSGTAALKDQASGLSPIFRGQMAASIRVAEQEFWKLRGAGDATAEQIAAAAGQLEKLEATARRLSAIDAFKKSFGDIKETLNSAKVKQFSGEMTALQNILSSAARTPRNESRRGKAMEAYTELQRARENELRLDEMSDRGVVVTPSERKAAEKRSRDAQKAAADAAAAATGRGRGSVMREMARGGDIGRMGGDKFSLALNQAAFAIDDFMSSTGGLEFKLRAVSNNITQLAFVLGGTTGLFVGLGAVIGGQIAVSLIKWANNGKSAEDQTKALNDSLAKQKGLVESLSQAYQALGKEIGRGTLSGDAEAVASIAAQRRAAMTTRGEASGEAIRASDARQGPVGFGGRISRFLEPFLLDREERFGLGGVADERALQNSLTKRRDESASVGERAFAQEELRQSRLRERTKENRLFRGPSATPQDMAERLRSFATAQESGRNALSLFDIGDIPKLLGARAISDIAQDIRGGNKIADRAARVEQLQAATSAALPMFRDRTGFFLRSTSSQQSEGFASQNQQDIAAELAAIEKQLSAAGDAVYGAMEKVADGIRFAQKDVTDAIEQGVVAAAPLQDLLNSLASDLSAAQSELEAALATPSDTPGIGPVQREQMIDAARRRVETVRGRQVEAEAQAREVLLGRRFGGERPRNALSAIQGNERFANQGSDTIFRLRGAINQETGASRVAAAARARQAGIEADLKNARAELRQVRSAPLESRDQEKESRLVSQIAAGEAALKLSKENAGAATAASVMAARLSDAAAAAAEFEQRLEQGLARIRKLGDTAIQESERGADAAQKIYTQNPLQGGAMEARDAAERRLIDDRARVAAAGNALDRARSEAMGDPRLQAIQAERERILSARKDADAAGKPINAGIDEQQRNRLVELERQEAQVLQGLTAARRREHDAVVAGITAREKELERSRQRDSDEPTLGRGRRSIDATLGDAQQAAEDAARRAMRAPSSRNDEDAARAERQLSVSRQESQELQDRLDRRRADIEAADPVVRAKREVIERERQRRAAITERAAKEGRALTPEERMQVSESDRVEREARAIIEGRIEGGTSGERYDIAEFRRKQDQRDAARRGRDLDLTERERFRRDMEEGVGFDIRARAAEIQAKSGDSAAEEYIKKAISEQSKVVAPMLEEFSKERETAMLQGPSRAKLEVSDVTTTQGQSELNRLLRGDDASKDVNLAELRKQTDALETLISVIRDNPLPVAE